MININKKSYIYIFCIVINFLLLILILINFNFLNTYNIYKDNLSVFITKIQNSNEAVSTINVGQTINKENANKVLPEEINNLSKVNLSISNFKSDKNYANIFNSLNIGVKNNILMYKQILSIINNPECIDINTSIKNVTKYKNSCNYYYSKVKSNNKCFSLPAGSLVLINNTSTYVCTVVNSRKNINIINNEISDFENKLEDAFEKFNSIKANLNYYAECSRKKTITYNTAILKVQKNIDTFSNFLYTFSEINVPSDKFDTYNAFEKILNDYNSYVSSFIYALKKEKAIASSSNPSSDYSYLYADTNKKFSEMNKALSSFKENFIP